MARNDEHTLNNALAECLRRRSPAWRGDGAICSESLGALEGGGRPDILIEPAAAPPVVVETEVDPAPTVEKDAAARLDRRAAATGAPIRYAVAVRLREQLRDVPESELVREVADTGARYAVVSSEGRSGAASPAGAAVRRRFPRRGWIEGGVDDLAGLVENLAVSEGAIAKSTDLLEDAIRRAAGRLRKGLRARPGVLDGVAELLHQDPGVQTERMAMAIVANACSFHAAIAGTGGERPIRTLDALRTATGALPRSRVLAEWRAILAINYWPIFAIARDILERIPSDVAGPVLGTVAEAADELAAVGVTRSHDLTGRMFQQLIQDRKFLATFYTRPEAAALLADLAVGALEVDWSDPDAMTRLRVADLACGTGTLLLAAYHALIARCRRAGGDDETRHRTMMERALIGADIMPAAAHLTASMLSSVHPTVPYRRTQVYTLPYGRDERVARLCLGTLSLLEGEAMPSLFQTGLAAGMTGLGGSSEEAVSERTLAGGGFALADGSLDLVIMNPPFTRPTNHEATDEAVPSFAGFGTTQREQREMGAELKRLRALVARRRRAAGHAPPASHGNAGLASNFLDLGHAKLRPGGVLAMVLPAAFALGKGWEASRQLLARHYRDVTVVSLAGASSAEKSFSADTGMAEVLLIARKRRKGAPAPVDLDSCRATWVSLARRPDSAAEARETARAARRGLASGSAGSRRAFGIGLGEDVAGGGIHASLADGGSAGVRDLSLAETALRLRYSVLELPRTGQSHRIAVIPLGSLGQHGPVDRDVGGRSGATLTARGPFRIVPPRGFPTFPVLWGHDAKRERRLFVPPDSMGVVRQGRDQDAASVWQTASRLHFNRDFRTNSQSLAACLTPERAIGGVAWPSFQPTDPAWEDALAAWANTTLGLLLFWWLGTTQQSGRTRLTITRLPDLPVVDLRALDPDQVRRLADAPARLAERECEFLPAHLAAEDPARKELDRLVLELALGFDAEAMEQVALLRRKWCLEPTVHGGKRRRYRTPATR